MKVGLSVNMNVINQLKGSYQFAFIDYVLLTILLTLLLHNRITDASVANCSPVKGQLSSIAGSVDIGHNGKDWIPASLESPLCEQDTLRVGPNSRAAITLVGDIMLRLDQNTTVRLVDLTEKPKERSIIELLTGALQSLSRSPRKLAVNTPYINGMIEGTEFLTRVEQGRAEITVFEGKVIAQNKLGSLPLTPGKSAQALEGQAPQPRIVIRPRDAVQWALYYPPILDFQAESFTGQASDTALQQSVLAYQKGDFKKAFELITKLPDSNFDSKSHAYRAALYLAVGRVEKANVDIEQMLKLNPKDSIALALQTIIKVVQDDKDKALAIATHAAQSAPDSTAILMALSYAQQAAFNLEGAQKSVEKIVAKEPSNALAWARLAELQASFGRLDDALSAANKASALKPDLSRTQTVLGFSQLMQVDTQNAKASFTKAIASASADPMARLGLGLAKIREGNLSEGRHEIEIAAVLDPNNAMVRSYLGKSYYEEKRTDLTDREYETAKELDPKDPTPYFYDAIQKQTTNRPVEALQSLQKAIELNDNRAVYRSRLLLDADLAARSSSLARVYTDLGFQQRALVEGWGSVNVDPSSFSAHRFLADSYSVLPRHEIARVSELLQSQLLQPLNMTPIQPHLAESNLFLIGAGGASGLSFNEFSPIFNRNGLNFQSSGLVGERNTYSGEGVVSGIVGKAAFSFGGFHFTSDGFRKNDDQKDDIANAFVQYEITPQTGIQAEYRYRNTNKGDIRRLFFPNSFFPGERNDEERITYRFGIRHNISEASTLLGSFIYQDAHLINSDNQQPGLISLSVTRPESSTGFELQHLFRSQYINLTSGVGYSNINGGIDVKGLIDVPPPDNSFTLHIPSDLKHTNAYTYSYLKPWQNLTLTLGLSGDFTEGDSLDVANINQLNPKLGILWEPITGTKLRAAVFRSLKRTLITNQTIEPTQVAGFNQFFDDANGTETWRYGVAIDQKLSNTLFAGAELSRRDLKVPAINDLGETIHAGWQENLARSYLFWAPLSWIALSAEYQYEQDIRDPLSFNNFLEKMDTHRVPLGIKVFQPSGSNGAGFNGSLTTTYYNQNGVFERFLGNGEGEAGRDNFWVFDATISYRLPKRYGFVSVGASNLLDEKFNYYDMDVNNPRIHSGRMIFGSLTLALP
jgi:Flp pilus assembly protein TadD